ncbi:hypothetical protein F5B22DRAFT_570445 [Xylaria bambusicola]|uniref:uncharacterized protein n=1 Tax=Xylaria bambusicola TaxID=326684 RepID=UPI0020082E79|nr:uncharacterized protein F5B22DRAFT_570445 [Xylaria bambusicola]KAI0521353.1 hypothetical protein F5B22DRAFT_570445 [Xylaria bambusicola]
MATAEYDARWLLAELKCLNCQPPWYSYPDPNSYGTIDPIFQRDGIVCLAYRAARRTALSRSHRKGQAQLRRNLQALDNTPFKHKEEVVMKISDNIGPELRQRILAWVDLPVPNPRKRPRAHDESMSPRTRSSEAVTSTLSSREHDSADTSQIHRSPSITETNADSSQRIPICVDTSAQKASLEHSFSTTPVSKAKETLPDQLYRILEKSYSYEQETFVAHIGMSYKNSDICQLTLNIHSGHVESCANTLFGVRLETTNGLRYINSGNAQILPSTWATISGCRARAIAPFFGQLLDTAIRESPTYQEDVMALCSDHTRAVSMVISQDANDAGVLILHTNLYTCVNIWDQLHSVE